jgi:hypothetical protein
MYPLRCLRVPPGVRIPQVEYHCSRGLWMMNIQYEVWSDTVCLSLTVMLICLLYTEVCSSYLDCSFSNGNVFKQSSISESVCAYHFICSIPLLFGSTMQAKVPSTILVIVNLKIKFTQKTLWNIFRSLNDKWSNKCLHMKVQVD